MIRNILFLLVALFCLASCNKNNDDNETVIEYQVIATNSSNIEITYHNVLGNKIVTSAQAGWSIFVNVPTRPFTAYLKGASTSPFGSIPTSCTVNIIVNGSLVKTETITSNSVAIAEAEYVVQ